MSDTTKRGLGIFEVVFYLIILLASSRAIYSGANALSRFWRHGALPPNYFVQTNGVGEFRYAHTNIGSAYVSSEWDEHWTYQGAVDAAWRHHEFLARDAAKGECEWKSMSR